jgi:hypothetical protein
LRKEISSRARRHGELLKLGFSIAQSTASADLLTVPTIGLELLYALSY